MARSTGGLSRSFGRRFGRRPGKSQSLAVKYSHMVGSHPDPFNKKRNRTVGDGAQVEEAEKPEDADKPGEEPPSAPTPIPAQAPTPEAPDGAKKRYTTEQERWIYEFVMDSFDEPGLPRDWSKASEEYRTRFSQARKPKMIQQKFEDLRKKEVERTKKEKETEDLAAVKASKKRGRAAEDDDGAPAIKRLRKAPTGPKTTQEGASGLVEVAEPGAVDWLTPVTFSGANDVLCLLNHRKMGKMSATQADYVCLVAMRQFIFRGIPEVDWVQVRDSYNGKFRQEPEATLVDIFWNYCQWFQDLSCFGPGVERSLSVGEWDRVLRIHIKVSGGPMRSDEDTEMSDAGPEYPGEGAEEKVVEEDEDSYLARFEMSDPDAPGIPPPDFSEDEDDAPTGGSQGSSRKGTPEYDTTAAFEEFDQSLEGHLGRLAEESEVRALEAANSDEEDHACNQDITNDSLFSLFNEVENKGEVMNDNECSRFGDESGMLAKIHTVGRIINDSILRLFGGVPIINEDVVEDPEINPSITGDSPIVEEDVRSHRIALDNAASMISNYDEDVIDDATLREITDTAPPEHSREDVQMIVDEPVIANDRSSKSRSPEPFLGDGSVIFEHRENNAFTIDSSILNEYARNRQIALDNAAMSQEFEEDSDLVMVDDSALLECSSMLLKMADIPSDYEEEV
jgi:hypothetical protein